MSNDFHHDRGPSLGHRSSLSEAHSSFNSTSHHSTSHLHDYDHLAIDAAREMHIQTTSSGGSGDSSNSGNVRWAMLAAACLVLFGNYYAFDNPASLNQPLQEYMQMSDEIYAYFLNILYTSYSLPNIVLPWLGGFAADKFGHRNLLLFLSAMVAFGHLVVCLGIERRNVPAIILGRVLFGAGESLAVTQSAITVKYFRGKELAMALGINLCIARLGSVLNDVLTPYIWSQSNVPTAFWGGFVSCVLSFMMACVLVTLDARYESSVKPGFSRLPMHQSDARFSTDSLSPITTMGAAITAGLYDPILSKSRKSEEFDLEVLHDSSGALSSRNGKKTSDSDLGSGPEVRSGHDRARRKSVEDESDDNTDDDGEDQDAFVQMRRPDTTKGDSPFRQCMEFLGGVLDYSQSFWVLFVMTFLVVGIQVPFNSIHAGFLQMRWYPGDPQKAAQVMTVPDLLSAILVLPIGFFVDHYGQKSWLFMLAGLIIGFSHFILGLVSISTPVPMLMALGVASAIGATITSTIPVLVKSHQIAAAYGLSSSAMNLAFTIFPLIVAKLMTVDPTVYTNVEIFFSLCGFCGFFLAARLRCLDIHGHLDRRELDNKIEFDK